MLLVGLLLLQIEFLSIRWPFNVGLTIFYGTRHGSWMLIGPVFFFYLKTLLRESIDQKEYLWFLPFAIFSILLPFALEDFLTYRQVHYGMLTPFDPRPDLIGFSQYLYSIVFIGQFFYLAFFLIKGKNLIITYRKKMKVTSSILPERDIFWLSFMWYGMLLILLLSSILIVLLFFTNIYRRHMDYLYVVPSSFLFYAISYKLIGVRFEKPVDINRYEKSGLKTEEVETYISDIRN